MSLITFNFVKEINDNWLFLKNKNKQYAIILKFGRKFLLPSDNLNKNIMTLQIFTGKFVCARLLKDVNNNTYKKVLYKFVQCV